MTSTLPVAVIGAGMAGLSCAQTLQAVGVDVHIFDKSRGPSGRMSTRRGDGWQCDHGAQYFTARHPDFRAEVGHWLHAGVADLWQPRLRSFDGSQWSTPQSVVERFVGSPRMTSPAAWLARDLPLTLQATINKLEHTADGWQITTAEHGIYRERFSAVVLAVPSVQAEPLLNPVAPHLAQIAKSAKMQGRWALMMQFASVVDMALDAAFINHGPISWLARDSSKPGRTGLESWSLHASALWSEVHMEDTPEQVIPVLIEAFRNLGGPEPVSVSAHRWRYADSSPALDMGCVWDSKSRLALCGDWLHAGKVEGAWLSGRLAAQRVLHRF
jgi:renalase